MKMRWISRKELSFKEKLTICVVLMVLLFFWYYLIRTEGSFSKIYSSSNEFLKTIDCAKIIDGHGVNQTYIVEFEIKAKEAGQVLVYFQNGSTAKYQFGQHIDVSTEYQRYVLEVCPTVLNNEVQEAYLAFYGDYGSGVIPTVRKIKFRVKE